MYSAYEAELDAADYEFNARYDYVREAYGDMIEDNKFEAYYDYCDACEEEGIAPLSCADWEAACRARRIAAPPPPDYGTDEIPF